MASKTPKTLVVFCAQSGPLISRRLDQLPVTPAVGVVFNFDKEFYQQVQPAMVCIGRAAGGAQRNLNVMLFEALSILHSPAEVIEILQRRICSYSIPDKEGGSSIILVQEKLEEGCDDLVLVQCKRLHTPQTGMIDIGTPGGDKTSEAVQS